LGPYPKLSPGGRWWQLLNAIAILLVVALKDLPIVLH
jgi:hypothetical protein